MKAVTTKVLSVVMGVLALASAAQAEQVSGLTAFHREGQTFLTWKEADSPVKGEALSVPSATSPGPLPTHRLENAPACGPTASRRRKSPSHLPPVAARRPTSRAGTTFVSLTTSRSPAASSSGRSRRVRCASEPSARFTTSSRAAARSASGSCAISTCGRS